MTFSLGRRRVPRPNFFSVKGIAQAFQEKKKLALALCVVRSYDHLKSKMHEKIEFFIFGLLIFYQKKGSGLDF
jgi:hypothetical protein